MQKHTIIFATLTILLFAACEKEIDLNLDSAEPFLAVDAFLTNKEGVQQIRLTYTQPYFENMHPTPALDATVSVIEEASERVYNFTDENDDGVYEWFPASPDDRFGMIGSAYALHINFKNTDYAALSRMDSVPEIDSITFEYVKKNAFISQDYYVGDFWARDLPGPGNAYWIKTWKNEHLLNRPDEINIAYDAGGSPGAEVDSLIFIQPVRMAINPFEEGTSGEVLPPYIVGDSIYLEIHSITSETWFFLFRVIDETFRPGGFAELFANPMANSPTNIVSSDQNKRVVGYFSVSAVSSLGVKVDEETIRDRLPD